MTMGMHMTITVRVMAIKSIEFEKEFAVVHVRRYYYIARQAVKC